MIMVWCGIAGFVLIMAESVRRRTDHYQDLCVATFILVFLLLLSSLGIVEGFLRPLTWDSRLRSWDLALGLDGFALARVWWGTVWLRIPGVAIYSGLPLVFALNWVLERSRTALLASIIGGALAFPCYLLVPACGPQYAFPGYPWHPSVLTGLTALSKAYARNCFPSMHFCWALLLGINARNRVLKTILFGYAALVGIAAVAGGEHYFVDLIAAVPFAIAVQWVTRGLSQWQTSGLFAGCNRLDKAKESAVYEG